MKTNTDNALREKHLEMAEAILKETNREKRWRLAADFAREVNPDVKKEQDYQIKACSDVRRKKLYKKTKTKVMGLRFAVSIPPMTFNALSQVDPSLRNIDKSEWSTKNGSNEIVRALERTFPEYKVS